MKRSVRRIVFLALLGVLIFSLISACTKRVPQSSTVSGSNPTDCRVVEHARGEACIPLNPQRVVTLDFNSFATALALDIKPIATWITTEIEDDFDYFKSKSNGIEILRSPTGQPNLETLVSLKPDLIIVISHSSFEGVYKYLPAIAPTIILSWQEIKGDWKQHIKDLARVFEKTEMATQLLDDYNQRINDLKEILNKKERIRTSFLYVATGQLTINRRESFAGDILADIGILNPLFEETGNGDLVISEEVLPKIDSDVIFIALLQKNDQASIDRIQQNPLWPKLKATQQNQVYFVDFSVWRGLNIFAAHAVIDDLYKYLVNRS
ncbi:MAG: iron-siderophore ABC transporter substrate-binding protein [Leptolyngbyaceae bacterium]|nr:iron-siderophore ABC transporter substrate-binding protein [Leptolyngbyaceae bacterium]